MITYTVQIYDTMMDIAYRVSKIKHQSHARMKKYMEMVEYADGGKFNPTSMRVGAIIRVPTNNELDMALEESQSSAVVDNN